jgi:pimeloyl-ACP methyl ester carboxylesterase
MQEKFRNTEPTEPAICTHRQSDGYTTHYLRWGSASGSDAVVLLHGAISHAGWQAPLGQAIASTSQISFIAMDRRGSGLNDEHRGHLISEEREIEDIGSLLHALTGSFARIHLAGWCFGGQVASIAAARVAGRSLLSSLILVAPGYVFSERYGDVLKMSMQAIFEIVQDFELKPDPLRAFIPIPLQPADFTDDATWLQFIRDDGLRLRKVTAGAVSVWSELADRSTKILRDLGELPVLAVLGSRDRLVDNDRVAALLMEHVRPAPVIELLDAHHAIQFEKPNALAALITGFVSGVAQRRIAVPARAELSAAAASATEA